MKQKSIGFASDLVPLIKEGSKKLTYRLGNKYGFLKVGDKIMVHDSSTGDDFAEVEITEKSYTDFQSLPTGKPGHENYQTKEDQRKIFGQYYKRKVDDNEPVLILGFKVVKLF